jgi:hypothetical protein
LLGLFADPIAQAQYPRYHPDVNGASDSLLNAARKHSDSAWDIAWPIIMQEAKNGKPMLILQAGQLICHKLIFPAFPGAEGGGKFSFGGRGGKVLLLQSE